MGKALMHSSANCSIQGSPEGSGQIQSTALGWAKLSRDEVLEKRKGEIILGAGSGREVSGSSLKNQPLWPHIEIYWERLRVGACRRAGREHVIMGWSEHVFSGDPEWGRGWVECGVLGILLLSGLFWSVWWLECSSYYKMSYSVTQESVIRNNMVGFS